MAACQSKNMALVQSVQRLFQPAVWLPFAGRYLPLRHRYVLTRAGRLRLRYSLPATAGALCLALSLVCQSGAPALFSDSGRAHYQLASAGDFSAGRSGDSLFAGQPPLQQFAAAQGRYDDAGPVDAAGEEAGDFSAVLAEAVLPDVGEEPPADEPPAPKEEILTIGKGDTLAGVLQKAGVSTTEAFSAVQAMKDYYDPRQLRPGQEIHVRFEPSGAGDLDFAAMRMDIDMLKSVSLRRAEDRSFEPTLEEKDVKTSLYVKNAEIELSLYGSAKKAGVPDSVMAEAIRVLSWDVDFQRDIRRGDTFDVMYEQVETEDGHKVRAGDIVYARLNVGGKDIPIYRYETPDGAVDYYTPDGASVRKALLKTPVDGARISSGFGVRKHPVLGYTKMHKGVDFAAPRGTPVYAAGDGTVERAGRWSTFGNYIRIRHNSSVETAYAHLNGFAKNVSAGKRVKQGQVIGYIGTTGRSTGPHLHYEVLLAGTQVNPKSVKLPQGEVLTGKRLAAFKEHVRRIDRQYTALAGNARVALGDAPAQRETSFQ